MSSGDMDAMLREAAIRIAGDIVMSRSPGRNMRKWREIFGVSQVELAHKMGISASVLSDYESLRRKSPGSMFIRRFVRSLLEIDIERGGTTLRNIRRLLLGSEKLYEAIIDMREFEAPVTIHDFCKAIEAELVVDTDSGSSLIYGYTIVDSIKLILEVPSSDYIRLYGATTQRAAIFTRVRYGRSPIVAVKAMQAGTGGLRPALVVLHGPEALDPLALTVARREGIPVAVTRIKDVQELVRRLRTIGMRI